MVELTTGYVAGLIAVCVVIAQLLFPTAITFFLAGHLDDRATAATWTVAGRALQSSYWPLLLQTDSSRNGGVRRSIIWITLTIPCLALLVSIAGIVTPMGLYESLEVSDDVTLGTFEYVQDSSAFLLGTSARTDLPFTRQCSYFSNRAPCPYTGDVLDYSWNGSMISGKYPNGLNSTVPQILHDIYMSGTKNPKTTISGFFDIEWRQLTVQYDIYYNKGAAIASAVYRYLESTLLIDGYKAIEGLVVDAKRGGVGFRNHTIPSGNSRGATWTEDILFLVPEVECVDMNLTTDFQVTMGSDGLALGFDLSQLNITDRGGFANLSKVNPLNQSHNMADEPNIPDLRKRAYKAAWFTNLLNMYVLNVTDVTDEEAGTKRQDRVDSEVGQQFKLPIPSTSTAAETFQGVQFRTEFGSPIGIDLLNDGDFMFSNPYNVTNDAYDEARDVCQGWQYNANLTRLSRDQSVSLNNSYVQCMLVQGAPTRTDSGLANIFEHESRWSAPLHMCASSVRATIKTVTFFHNGSREDLDNLVIKDIQEKNYSKKEDLPLWGVEAWSSLRLQDMDPIWGLVDSSLEGFQNVSTLRAESLYLLGVSDGGSLDSGVLRMNTAGAIAPFLALEGIGTGSTYTTGTSDYSGRGSLGVWMKWKQLSRSADTAADIIKLLWTDVMSSAVVGSKGVLGSRNMEPDEAAGVGVRETVRYIKYKWGFGVPAFLVILLMLLVCLLIAFAICAHQSDLNTIRQRINQVSLGRVLTTIYFPDSSGFTMPSDVWNRANGDRVMDMAKGCPVMDNPGDSGHAQYQQVQYMPDDGRFAQGDIQYPQGEIQYVQQGDGQYIPVQVFDQSPVEKPKA